MAEDLTLFFSEMLVTMDQTSECQYPDEHSKWPPQER